MPFLLGTYLAQLINMITEWQIVTDWANEVGLT